MAGVEIVKLNKSYT